MFMIDNVYKESYKDSEDFLKQLKRQIATDPIKFETDFRNLKSFIIDLESEQRRKEELKRYHEELAPQKMREDEEFR